MKKKLIFVCVFVFFGLLVLRVNKVLSKGSGSPSKDNVAFVSSGQLAGLGYNYNGFVLLMNGDTWSYQGFGTSDGFNESWSRDTSRDLPTGVTVKDIVQWNGSSFLTKDGTIYVHTLNDNAWMKKGDPIINPNFENLN